MFDQSHLIKHEKNRSKEFKPNTKLTAAIEQLKFLLEPVQKQLNSQLIAPKYPVVIILGNPRSGTTLLTQVLAETGYFAYPSNFISRFSYAPQLGAIIQQMLFNPEFDLHGELSDIQSAPEFSSSLGKTSGALSINEFFHFWRKFFPNDAPEHIPLEQLKKIDISLMRKELAGIQMVFDKPFVSKGKMMQFNLKFFAEAVPELFFIHIKREPKYVMRSVMRARQQYYVDDRIWWSVKPKEYEFLAGMPTAYQVAGQVLFTDKAIDEGLSSITESRKVSITYEDLCAQPQTFFNELRGKFSQLGVSLGEYNLKQSFTNGNKNFIVDEQSRALNTAYNELQDKIKK